MGLWSDKILLSWTEPKIARETREALAEERASARWQIISGLGIFLFFLLKIGIRFIKKNNWPLILMAALAVAIGFPYIRRRFAALFPSTVEVTDKVIRQSVAGRHSSWRYADIEACRVLVQGQDEETAA